MDHEQFQTKNPMANINVDILRFQKDTDCNITVIKRGRSTSVLQKVGL